jgi:uncharacterized protein YndB with AHSA1/START domain
MNPNDKSAPSTGDSLSMEFELPHAPEKVWRALTDAALLAEWLLPVFDFKLDPGAAFTFRTQAFPGWDGTVNCRMLEIEKHRKLSYTWSVPFLDTVVTFTLAPERGGAGTRLTIVQSGFKPDQKREFGGARYGWTMMGGKLADLLGRMP